MIENCKMPARSPAAPVTEVTEVTETSSPTGGPIAGRRRQARSAATRTALLDAALQEFAAYGFEGASTRSIAAAAGTHQPQINYHFESKDALWRAAVDHLFALLDAAVGRHLRTLPSAGDDRERFARGVRAFVRAAAELPELNRIMVQEATVESDRLAWIVERHTGPRFATLTADWRRLRSAGSVPDIDETVLYYSLVGAASLAYVNAPEALLLGRDTLDPAFIDAHADALVTLFLGIGR
jgi:AcrR family transcriptional regulator